MFMFMPDRVKILREELGYSVEACAYELEINREKYEQIENGRINPSCQDLVKMARFLGVSIDHLMGMDIPESGSKIFAEDREDDDFVVRLTRLMTFTNESVTTIAKAINKSPACVYAWKRHRSTPDVNSVIRLAEHFGCTTDYLLGVSNQRREQPGIGRREQIVPEAAGAPILGC